MKRVMLALAFATGFLAVTALHATPASADGPDCATMCSDIAACWDNPKCDVCNKISIYNGLCTGCDDYRHACGGEM